MSECAEKCDVDLSEEGLVAIGQRAQNLRHSAERFDVAVGRVSAIETSRDVAALVAEVRRLRKRDSAWRRATGCGEPEQVHERTVRLCSCDGAILPQIGDEVDACWECDGLVKVTESDESADATDGAAS